MLSQIEQKLFDTYCESELRDMGCGFDEAELDRWLEGLPIGGGEKARYKVLDGLFDYYRRWASSAFQIGLNLGLSCPRGPSSR